MDVKTIITRIEKLNQKEKAHILDIFNTHEVEFSKNANGFFYNLSRVDQHVLVKIYDCLKLIEKNRDIIAEMDRRRDELLIYYKQLIEDKLQATIRKKREAYLQILQLQPLNTNITQNVTRIVKRKVTTYDDVDVLMRDYIKSRHAYSKNSVYARLHVKMRASRNKYLGGKDMTDFIENQIDGECDEFAYDDADDLVDENITEVETESFDVPHLEKHDDESCDTDCSAGSDGDDGDDGDVEEETHILAGCEEVEKAEADMLFYKKILSQKGLYFNDITSLKLEFQEYIE